MYRAGVPVPTAETLLICDVTPALWSKLAAVVSPQWAQSIGASVDRFCVPVGVVTVPVSSPLTPDVIVRPVLVPWASAPLVRVMASVDVPAGVAAVVLPVSVEVPAPPLIAVGLKVAVAPVGSPESASVVVPVNPLTGETVTV